jgi:hypothetical protein
MSSITLPAMTANVKPASPQFWTLALFVISVWLTGGASRVDAQSLILLRPLSVVVCALALLTLRREHIVSRKWLFAGFGCIMLLCLIHLVPLPPNLWKSLPGRELFAEIDKLAGLGEVWRPLTITPMNGWHAFASLITPLAVLLLGVQLNREDLYRLLPLLLALGGLSGLLGVLQIMGDPQGSLYLYRITNNGSAVGLFANRNHAAVMLACLFPMLSVYASISRGTEDTQRMRQFLAVAVGIMLIPLILVTGSRSGILMTLPALIVAAFLYRKPIQGRSVRRGEGRFQLKAGYSVAGAIVASLVLLTIIFSRAAAVDRLLKQSAVEDSRADYWDVGLKMIAKYFPFGSGTGSFVEAYQIHEPVRTLTTNYVNHMHNDWLEIPLTGGLPAIAILMVAVGFYTLKTIRLWRGADRDRRAVKIAKLASALILIIALASAADYPLRTPIIMSVFAILCLWFSAPVVEGATDGLSPDEGR